jgi:putative endonuclease
VPLKQNPLKRLWRRLRSADPRHRLGAAGEKAARAFLEAAGYQFIARNVTTPFGELDLVMTDGDCLDVVEDKVAKSAASLPAKLQVNREKQKHLRNATLYYIKSKRWTKSARIDVMGRNGDQPFEHVKGAVPLG